MGDRENILQIDVEDWYCDLDIRSWHLYEDRVVSSTEKVLALLEDSGAQATFFILGYVAERHPNLVEKIRGRGHEIASHGYAHKRLTAQSPQEFEEDLIKSLGILQGITGADIWGYRAPQFTVMEETAWAIDILKKNGLKYDSSIFPVKTPLYGVPGAPRFPYHISSDNIKSDQPQGNFWEIPLSVYQLPFIKKNIPVAGGIYLRLLPYKFMAHALRQINKNNNVAVCYLHPWELDISKPRLDSLKWNHYYNCHNMENKLKEMLRDFKFTSTLRWIENAG